MTEREHGSGPEATDDEINSPENDDRKPRRSDRFVDLGVRALVAAAAFFGNVIGAATVFVLAVWVLPTDELPGEGSPILVNLVLAGGYVLATIPLATWLVLRRQREGRRWIKEERDPTAEELRAFLRAPIHVAVATTITWFLAALFFGTYNATYSVELGSRVALTVGLAGLTTGAVSYLVSERFLRPAATRALARTVLPEPAMPGVTARITVGWLLASGVPLIGLLMAGISTLVERDFSRNQLAITVISLAGIAIVVGFVVILLAARSTAAPVIEVREAMGKVEAGDLKVSVDVYDGSELGLLQSGFNEMADGLRERERMRELFGQHVGEDVAREAIEAGTELGGETREVAVLFVDVVGSTEIASERPATEVVELLNRFFGVVVEVVGDHQGWVNKFEGDAALAIFGAPRPLEDSAGRALAAGRTLARRLADGNDEVAAGIGISFGKVVAGNIGSQQRLEYTVIGDAVNEAARLTELAKEEAPMLLASDAAIDAAGSEEAERWELGQEVELRGRGEETRLATPSE
ncbi:MAG: adenylate/guanylate cyclase domain-containing protein [Solirubrobacterales bacterium]